MTYKQALENAIRYAEYYAECISESGEDPDADTVIETTAALREIHEAMTGNEE